MHRKIQSHLLAIGVAVLSLMAGCATHTPADPDRASLAATSPSSLDWPARWTDDLDGIAKSLATDYLASFKATLKAPDEVLPQSITFTLIHCKPAEVHGVGIVRETWIGDKNPAGEETGKPTQHAVSTGQFSLSFLSWVNEPDRKVAAGDTMEEYMKIAVTGASLTMPAEGEPHGLAVTFGPYTLDRWSLRDRLPERGWAVLHIGFTRPIDRPSKTDFDVKTSDDPVAAAAPIADEINQRLANYAYAVEAYLSYIRAHVESLRDAPVVVVGASRGALIVPTVAARNIDSIDAAVIMLGGANLLDIVQKTSFHGQELLTAHWKDDQDRDAVVSSAQRAALTKACLEAAHLDPYYTTACLGKIKVLDIDAKFDTIVPRTNGQLLYERLGKPERWTYPFGHVGAYWWLNQHPDPIIDWMDAAVGAGDEIKTK